MTHFWQHRPLRYLLTGLVGLSVGTILTSCTTVITDQYEATALTTYTWQVEYQDDLEDRPFSRRLERFASTSLLNRNGMRPDDAVTGPDDQGLWWPATPPRPTVDELEASKQTGEQIGTPELIKSVEYAITFEADNQTKTLPTDYSVYRQVVKAYPSQEPLELTLGVNDSSVEKADPQ